MKRRHAPTRRRFLQGAGLAAGGVAGHAFGAGAAGAAAQAPGGASPGARFRALLERPAPSRCINCGDVATARLAEMHGFEMVMTGGSALSLSKYGTGDFGVITMDDLVEFCNRTADAVGAPIIADADDGGGNPLNVYRTVRRLEKAGAACIMIEDLYGAKHLAGYDEGRIIGREAMVDKVRAAADARRDSATALLVRSDVAAGGGPLEEAIERVALYAQAGGDVVFVPGIPLDRCREAVERAGRPILTGAPSVDAARENGVGIVFVGAMGAIALGAVDDALAALARDGRIGAAGGLAGPRRLELVRNEAAVDRARRYNALREDGR